MMADIYCILFCVNEPEDVAIVRKAGSMLDGIL